MTVLRSQSDPQLADHLRTVLCGANSQSHSVDICAPPALRQARRDEWSIIRPGALVARLLPTPAPPALPE